MPGEYTSYQAGQKRRRDDHDDYNNRRQRISPAKQMLLRLRREIVEIGEPSRFKVSQMMHHLGQGLGGIDMDETRNGVMETIEAVIVEQPHKIPLLAGALQIGNFQSEVIGQTAVELVHTRIENYISNSNWTYVKVFVRMLACLAPIVEGDGVFNLFSSLMTKAVDLQKQQESRSGAAEEIYAGIMLALPFYLKTGEREGEPDAKLAEQVDQIIGIASDFEFKSTEGQRAIVSPFIDADAEKLPYDTKEFVQLVKAGVMKLAENEWKVPKLIDVAAMVRLYSNADQLIENQKLHTFPTVNLPETIENTPTKFYKYPRLFFQAYMPTLFETVPPPGTFEAVIIRDIATDIINGMDFNRKEVARQLITLDLFFAPPTFAPPGISFDRLEGVVEQGKSSWKVEDVALEAVLDHIFNLPKTHHKPAYYDSILIEACIMAPQAIAPVFGRAIRFLYSNLECLDVEAIQNYLEWFSHHLSNFGFTWKWQEWVEDAELPAWHPKKVFIQQLILKEVRLCYADRVKETLTPEFVQFLPAISEEITFKYIDGEGPYHELVSKLMVQLQDEEQAELDQVLSDLREKVTNESVGGSADAIDKTIIDILIGTVCYLGSRSLSHAETWIEKTSKLLNKLIKEDENADQRQEDAMTAALNFWKEQPYVGLVVMWFLVRASILDSWKFVEYILKDESLIVSNHGWNAITRLMDSHHTDEELRKKLVNDMLELLAGLDAGDDEWKQWWYDGLIRAFARRYHKDLPESNEKLDKIDTIVRARSL